MTDQCTFAIEIQEYDEVHSLPGDWTHQDIAGLLAILEVDTADAASEADLRDLLLMALSDIDADAASEVVLEYVFGDNMKSGARQNLVHDLEDDRPWEQFADPAKQAGVFRAVTLLQEAFPKQFGVPDAARLRVKVSTRDRDGAAALRGTPAPALVVRLLAAGMPDRAVLRRLFADAIAAGPFSEAEAILWRVDAVEPPDGGTPGEVTLDVYSSIQWLAPLDDQEPYEARVDLD